MQNIFMDFEHPTILGFGLAQEMLMYIICVSIIS